MDLTNLRFPLLLLLLLPLLALLVAVVGAGTTEPDETSWCPMNATEPAPEGARVVDGNLLAAGRPERSYPPSQYRRPAAGGGRYLLCPCAIERCLRKCCKPDMVYVLNKGCSAPPEDAIGKFENFTVPKFTNGNETYETDKFHLVYGKIVCPRAKYRLQPFMNHYDNFRVSETGWLLNGTTGSKLAPPGLFCLDRFSDNDFQIASIVCSLTAKELNLTDVPAYDGAPVNVFYTIGMMLSLPFLLATFLVYALVKELRNLHGKSLMCHVATMLVAYTSLVIVQLTTNDISTEVCTIFAYIIQFSFMASFFWLNVMCFDLWWTFSGFRPLRGNARDHEQKKFIIYSIYSWVCPFLISVFTFYMDVSSNTLMDIRPEFGVNSCWFATNLAKLIYFYGPIGVLLFANLLMFVYTAVMIVKHMREAKVLCGSESSKNVDHEKQRFVLYLNLFIVMGVNWLAEILSWAFSSSSSESLWYVTDIGNSLQGVFIFIIFVCKKRVLKLLNKKLCPKHQFLTSSSNSSSKTTYSEVSKASTNKNKGTLEMTTTSTNNELRDFKL